MSGPNDLLLVFPHLLVVPVLVFLGGLQWLFLGQFIAIFRHAKGASNFVVQLFWKKGSK